ncbi:hypothetical protein SSTU70S_00033 [Stutzerimonas stutzeri]
MAQLLVIVEILVAQRDAHHPLRHQRAQRKLHRLGHPIVLETAGQAIEQPHRFIGLFEQQRAAIRTHPTAIKSGYHRAPPHP